MIISINNWAKYNPRSDVKSSSWLRLEHSLFEDYDLYTLKPEEMCVWVYLLCLASKKSGGVVQINFTHAKVVARLSEKTIKSAISKLKAVDKVKHVDVTCTNVDVTTAAPTYGTLRNERTNERLKDFDFEKVYESYPRKEGKTAGLKKCAVEIKTQLDFENLLKAVERYSKDCRDNRTEKKFVKHFSSFMTSWKDYIPTNVKQKPIPTRQELTPYQPTNAELHDPRNKTMPKEIKELLDTALCRKTPNGHV